MVDQPIHLKESSRDVLISELKNKDKYINKLLEAIDQHNDLLVYQLLGPERYQNEIDAELVLTFGNEPFELVKNQRPDLAHFLSDNLIDYLIKKFPFFYYREVEKGKFKVFFGNWWDCREIGTLDPLNIEYNLNVEELDKLEKSLRIEDDDQTLNSEAIKAISLENFELQKVAKGKFDLENKVNELKEQFNNLSERGGLFESNKIKEERQKIKNAVDKVETEMKLADEAPKKIRENQKKILNLAKEDTILKLEMDTLKQVFNDFEDFKEATKRLYQDYIENLLNEGQVKSDG